MIVGRTTLKCTVQVQSDFHELMFIRANAPSSRSLSSIPNLTFGLSFESQTSIHVSNNQLPSIASSLFNIQAINQVKMCRFRQYTRINCGKKNGEKFMPSGCCQSAYEGGAADKGCRDSKVEKVPRGICDSCVKKQQKEEKKAAENAKKGQKA